MDPKIAEDPKQDQEDPEASREDRKEAISAILRTTIPPKIELLRYSPFDDVIALHDQANRDLARHMESGLMGVSKDQTGRAFLAFVNAVACCAFATGGVTIAGEHFEAVHPEVEVAKKRGRVLGFDALIGFLGALGGTHSATREDPDPDMVRGLPPELRDDSSEETLARRRRKFGTDL